MPDDKNDTSTGIEDAVKTFAKDMTKSCAGIMKQRAAADKKAKDKDKGKSAGKKESDDPPEITFALDPSPITKSRTPAEQAQEVADGKSWVCWGAHMSDKARHVIMKVDGKISWDAKKALGEDFGDFKKAWASNMKGNGLKNANSGDGWYDGDAFHLEMADAKIDRTDERAEACLAEYVRLTREAGSDPNGKFEKAYAKELKPYIDAAEKKAAKKAKP